MTFSLHESINILDRTPRVLTVLLLGLPEHWVKRNEGPDTWSAYDILGHLIHGERTDWVPRMEIILSNKRNKTFEPFDRFAQFREDQNLTMSQLLEEFTVMRERSLSNLRSKKLTEAMLTKKGVHPEFGEVTLAHLLATWVVHDLNHIHQICRVLAKQYGTEVGPWAQYLGILKK